MTYALNKIKYSTTYFVGIDLKGKYICSSMNKFL